MNKPISVLIADDHTVVLAGFVIALKDAGYEIAAAVTDAQQAIDKYFELRPDVVILDIRYGTGISGTEAAAIILERDPKAKIIFLSQFDQAMLIKSTYQMGGAAFLLKSCTSQELADAVMAAYQGKTYYTTNVAMLLADFSVHGNSPQDKLDERELNVFIKMAKGMTAQEISEETKMSLRLVSDVFQSIKRKLDVTRPAELTLLAVQYNLIDLEKRA